MAIEPADRHHPAPWFILGPMLFAGLLSAGLALLVVVGAPPWKAASGTAERISSHSGSVPARAAPAASAAAAAPLGAGRTGTAYRPAPASHRHPDGFHRSLLVSGILGLAIAIIGGTMIGRRRQMW